MNISVPFALHVTQKLRLHQIIWSVATSLVVSVTAGVGFAYLIVDSDQIFARSIAPHVSTLVETNDRPELQRFVSSIGAQKGLSIDVIENGVLIASTRSFEDIGRTVTPRVESKRAFGIAIEKDSFISEAPVLRNGGSPIDAQVILYSPVFRITGALVSVALTAFFLTFLITQILVDRMGKAVRVAIEPIEQLHSDIQSINSGGPVTVGQLKIEELELVRQTVHRTKADLAAANAALVDSKARELAGEAYRRLLHDLHTPVSALKQHTKNAANEEIEEIDRAQSRFAVADLAEQILLQVKAAKANLNIDVKLAENADLSNSVSSAASMAFTGSNRMGDCEFVQSIPSRPIPFLHDTVLLKRAVANLVSNAIEACTHRVELEIIIESGRPQIHVRDDGPGMAPEEVSAFLLGKRKSSKPGGSGLGLSNSNHIIRSHGGRIIYKPSHLGGAQFEIRL